MFCKFFLPLGMSCSLLIPLDPSPGHHTWGRSSMVNSQLRGCSLHGLWQVTSSISTPPPSVEQKGARILREFLLAFIKHFCHHQTEENREEWTLIIATQMSFANLSFCKALLLWAQLPAHGVWLVQASAEPSLGFSLAQVLSGFPASAGPHFSGHWPGELSSVGSSTSSPTSLALCPSARPVTWTLEHSSD